MGKIDEDWAKHTSFNAMVHFLVDWGLPGLFPRHGIIRQ
jgi:hypothetical protein